MKWERWKLNRKREKELLFEAMPKISHAFHAVNS